MTAVPIIYLTPYLQGLQLLLVGEEGGGDKSGVLWRGGGGQEGNEDDLHGGYLRRKHKA